jgi:hypothetical protein
MHTVDFFFETNASGMVVLKGLSPEEMFEYEELANQCDDRRSSANQRRLDEPNTKHCSALKREPANGTG